MKIIANRQLRGEYGVVVPDQEFECREETATQLLKSGLVRHALPPKVQYETKIITPEAPEVSAREPFRNVPDVDPEPETVAPKGPHVLSSTNIFENRTTDPGGRGGRSGSGPRR